MSILGSALSLLSPEDLLTVIAKYGPAIEALIGFIERERDDKLRAVSMDAITRGLQYASQTGDPSQLEVAIKAHCGVDGCRLP